MNGDLFSVKDLVTAQTDMIDVLRARLYAIENFISRPKTVKPDNCPQCAEYEETNDLLSILSSNTQELNKLIEASNRILELLGASC